MLTLAEFCLASFLITISALSRHANCADQNNDNNNYALTTLADLLAGPQAQPPEELANDEQYQSQLGMLLAELESQLLASDRAQEFFREVSRFGLPSFDNLRFRDNYIVSYDNRLKHPVWAIEYLKGTRVRRCKVLSRSYDGFDLDFSVHGRFRSTNEDYEPSGYDRGHYAPACDNKCLQSELDESYLLTNVGPQVPELNRSKRPWSRLESYICFLSRRSRATYVITGALYMPKRSRRSFDNFIRYRVIGQSRVGVPDYYYKIVLYETNAMHLSLEAFVLPNSVDLSGYEEVERYRISITKDLPRLEKLTGLRFFELLPKASVTFPWRFKYGYEELSGSYDVDLQPPGFGEVMNELG